MPAECAAPPTAMDAELAALCKRARSGRESVYGSLLRENVADVLQHSFPAFVARYGNGPLADAVDAFVVHHRAARPQFHHIATEFVAFAQARLQLDASLLAVLEYEWCLLSVEIDPCVVPRARSRSGTGLPLSLNPTLRFVLLPFDPEDLGSALGEVAAAYFAGLPCAIYRKADHSVEIRRLTHEDCRNLEAIRQAMPLANGPDPFPAQAWLARALADEMITVVPCQMEKTS